MSPRQSVVLVGPTGHTGRIIIEALIDSGTFDITAVVRPVSLNTAVQALKPRGVTVIALDLETSSKEDLLPVLKGVDTVISVAHPHHLEIQHNLIDAAKEMGVKRFVPCDFGTPCVPGVRKMYDTKTEIHKHIERVGLGHTYIDVGFWFSLQVPVIYADKAYPPWLIESTKYFYEKGDKKILLTDLDDIGRFVTRIIKDERTLNRYVIAWSEEVTQMELFALAQEIYGQEIGTMHKTADDIRKLIQDSLGAQSKAEIGFWEYMYSMHIRGDNTLENAKKLEYGAALDARELYPDFTPKTLVDYMKEHSLK